MSDPYPSRSLMATPLARLQQVIASTRARMITPPAQAPTIVAVSKTHPAEAIIPLIASGLTHFAENRVQEAQAKWPALRAAYPGLTLHLIGPLQSNKVADAVALFDVIETIDRPKIADAIAQESARQGKRPTILIQVNTGEEPQKAGVAPDGLDALVAYVREKGLALAGLMCIPPADQPSAPHFALLRTLAQRHGLGTLSMGMSSDYPEAIRMGATHIRIGTALFGERDGQQP